MLESRRGREFQTRDFVSRPASYEIVAPDNVYLRACLTGTPYVGARFLHPVGIGFESASPLTGLALLWAAGWQTRNFTPFAHHALSDR